MTLCHSESDTATFFSCLCPLKDPNFANGSDVSLTLCPELHGVRVMQTLYLPAKTLKYFFVLLTIKGLVHRMSVFVLLWPHITIVVSRALARSCLNSRPAMNKYVKNFDTLYVKMFPSEQFLIQV